MRRVLRPLLFLLVASAGCACASPPPPKPAPKPEPAPVEEAPAPEPDPAPETWQQAVEKWGHQCPGPFFKLPEKKTVKAAGRTFEISGSTLRLVQDGGWRGPLKIGVLGAIKDAEYNTQQNIKKAAREFKKLGVHIVVANGDLIGDEAGDLAKVAKMLGETIKVPLFVHSGNYEWTSAFTETFTSAEDKYPQIFNMNLLRHVDLGGVHLFSLPGWSVRQFVKPAACYYDEEQVAALEQQLKPVVEDGETVIVVAHGPPRGRGKQSLDFAANAGNVGDEALQAVLKRVPVKFGIFSHILEAGGRATSDVERQTPIKLPMRRPVDKLYLNAGSASSFGWRMLDKKTSRGMAAVVVIDDIEGGGNARVSFLKLR